MPNLILASGPITNSDDLTIELVNPSEAPPAILIRWPGGAQPTVCAPTRFPAAALAAIAVLDNAMQELTRMERRRRASQR